MVLHAFTVVDKKNVAFSSLKSHTLHSRNPIQHQKQIQQAYAEKYCWIKLFEDDAAHMLTWEIVQFAEKNVISISSLHIFTLHLKSRGYQKYQ